MTTRSLWTWLTLAALGGLVVLPTAAQAAPTELKKVHVLLVFDNADKYLQDSLRIDIWRMKRFVQEQFPEERCTFEVLTGERASRDGILGHYRNGKVSSSEGLFFFYGGHGALDPTKRPYFKLTHGKVLYRSELRQTMEATGAGLVVLLTDCCSNLTKKAPRGDELESRKAGDIKTPQRLSPTIRNLFYLARGTVDITASTEDVAWGDKVKGGIFTRAVCRMLGRPLKELDTNRDGVLTWDEFFPQLQKDTELDFAGWSRRMRSVEKEEIESTTQKPAAYLLGGLYAVVGIENATTGPLVYECRWSEQQAWEKVRLAPGTKKAHFVRLNPDDKVSPLLARFEGIRTVQKLGAKRWTGQGTPGYANGTQYRIRPRK
jgi:hypothetical protein